MRRKVFGKKPSGDRLSACMNSVHYNDGKFQNIEPTTVMGENVSFFKLLKDFFGKPKTVVPSVQVPFVHTDLLQLYTEKPTIIWFGHSSYLIHSKGLNILVDPVFSGHASPFSFIGKSFPGTDHYQIEDFPPIDILLLTHDHYDHLDIETITRIHPGVKQIITSLGVGAHLEYWGIKRALIKEIDWWQEQPILPGVEIIAAPARHFSGRGLIRGKTAWSSFLLKIHGSLIFIGGDSGYDQQFKVFGEKYGAPDLAILECGQYNADWPHIHMFPEETVEAARDLKAKVLMPVHWAKFALSTHPWNEPAQRLIAAAERKKQAWVIPMIGQPYTPGEPFRQKIWWEF